MTDPADIARLSDFEKRYRACIAVLDVVAHDRQTLSAAGAKTIAEFMIEMHRLVAAPEAPRD